MTDFTAFEAQFADVDLPEFPGPMVYDTRKMYSGGVLPVSPDGIRQEFGELKQPEIVGWTEVLGEARPIYAVPGFLRDPTYFARKERRDHIIMLLEMRRYTTPVFGFRQRKVIDAAIERLEEKPV